ncbi:protein FAM178A [Striga asiatica]|uniref:Protein FAM178A n=1 Tax=Striga asiatica TaxID=4170 RepID=A0A5A7PEB2_STRAF|nr:protein FAM178A [Striga asiatica]
MPKKIAKLEESQQNTHLMRLIGSHVPTVNKSRVPPRRANCPRPCYKSKDPLPRSKSSGHSTTGFRPKFGYKFEDPAASSTNSGNTTTGVRPKFVYELDDPLLRI